MIHMGNGTQRKKRGSELITIKKSPYFASIRRKPKMFNDTLVVTKYERKESLSPENKKKVFKRFGKFVEIDS